MQLRPAGRHRIGPPLPGSNTPAQALSRRAHLPDAVSAHNPLSVKTLGASPSVPGFEGAVALGLPFYRLQAVSGTVEEKGDGALLCEAPFGPFRQKSPVPFFGL